MSSRDFVYWLQGYFELCDSAKLSEKQGELIKKHLNLVFEHEIDPSLDDGNPNKKFKYDSIHGGGTPRC